MLSDRRIIREMQYGNIIIEPFNAEYLGSNSYDCHLGDYFCEMDPTIKEVFLDDPLAVQQLWLLPRPAEIIEGRPYIPVRPGETILAHTQEFVGGLRGIVPTMKSRSSVARCGLSVCRCAGVGDVGYNNKWTMEICNHTKTKMFLRTGMRICQFIFDMVGTTIRGYEGHYQYDVWKPELMLPNPYLAKP